VQAMVNWQWQFGQDRICLLALMAKYIAAEMAKARTNAKPIQRPIGIEGLSFGFFEITS